MNAKTPLRAGLCLLAALTLAGCSQPGPASSGTASQALQPAVSAPIAASTPPDESRSQAVSPLDKPRPEADAPPAMQYDLHVVKANLAGPAYAEAPAGCYTLHRHEDASDDILYIDYEAGTLTQLAAPALAPEAQGSLAAHGASTVAFAKDYLYHIDPGLQGAEGEDFHPATLTRLEPDATKPMQIALPYGELLHPETVLLAEGSLLYLMAYKGGEGALEAGSAECILYRLDFTHQTCEEVSRFEAGRDIAIEAGIPSGFLLRETLRPGLEDPAEAAPESAEAAAAADPAAPPAEAVEGPAPELTQRVWHYTPAAGESLMLEWQGERTVALLDDAQLYHWEARSGSILRIDLESGESMLVASGFIPEDIPFDKVLLPALVDGRLHLALSDSATGAAATLLLDVSTGSLVPAEEAAAGLPLPVYAENDSWLLVGTGTRWAAYLEKDPALGEYWRQLEVPVYALVSPEHYRTGTAEYTPIEDLVYQ